MDTYPYESWVRLGRLLERRRADLGYGFRQRARFAMERGNGRISLKTISRLEKGERDSYPESTIGTIERMYRWSSGSVEAVLMGGEPRELPTVTEPVVNPITRLQGPPTSGERLASWIYVRMKQRGTSEDAIHDFLESEGLPREPDKVAAVKRIADATGATLNEVLALLGVDDIDAYRVRPKDEIARTDSDTVGNGTVGTPT
jgi:hypothetical protein